MRIALLCALSALLIDCSGAQRAGIPTYQQCTNDAAGGPVISGILINPSGGAATVAIRITNLSTKPYDLAGASLTDAFGTRVRRLRDRGHERRRDLIFPSDTTKTVLAPRGHIWVARDAAAFKLTFGFAPTFEVNDDRKFPANDPDVRDIIYEGPPSKRGSWLGMSRRGAGILALVGADNDCSRPPVLDVVPYNFKGGKKARKSKPSIAKLRLVEEELGLKRGALWTGPPLMTAANLFLPSPPFSVRNRVFSRDYDAKGRMVADTNSYRDWDAASSFTGLGETANHRLWVPGQSHFMAKRHDEKAIVTMTASPDSNFAATVRAMDQAKKDIKVHIYYFTSTEIGAALVAAVKRGVNVTLAMEGGVVGVRHGFSDKEREIARQIEEAGKERSKVASHGFGRVLWLRSDRKAGIDDRYSYDHSKYVIIDGRWIIVGSENYGSTGHSVSNTQGNRGWEVQLRTPEGQPPLGVVRDLEAVWNADVNPKRHRDYVRYTDAPQTLDEEGRGRYGPPPKGTKLKSTLHYGRYVPRDPPEETVTEKVGAELVVSPDTSLAEHSGILKAIASAKHTLLIEHLAFAKHWGGKRKGSVKKTPNVLLQACLAAARRGVKVRLLLSCRGFACDRPDALWEKNEIDNDDVYELVNRIAKREKLDLEARLLDTTSDDWLDDPEEHGVHKIHNKGMVIDGHVTLFASINGAENSFKANREVGVLVDSAKVGQFYERLFWYDWTTVMQPGGLAAMPAAGKKALKSLRKSAKYAGVMLTGLKPATPYYLRVSTVDWDDTDVENTNPPTQLGPHESPLSAQIQAKSSAKGTLLVLWKRNKSECLEGDLAGYKLYYDTKPGAIKSGGMVVPEDVKRLKLFSGTGAKQGPSPIMVPAGDEQPQCVAMRALQVKREPKPVKACVDLVSHVGACVGKAGETFPQLDKALKPHGPLGSKKWQRRQRSLVRACSSPPRETARYWQKEREMCAPLTDCTALYTCMRRAEFYHHRQLLQADKPKRRKGKWRGRRRGKGKWRGKRRWRK
ncbi:MAG: hypothetical protein KC502_17060 [Myxococcales bacterium]|nr:hypothetical protein [Myxococcales bacterium]